MSKVFACLLSVGLAGCHLAPLFNDPTPPEPKLTRNQMLGEIAICYRTTVDQVEKIHGAESDSALMVTVRSCRGKK